MKIVAYILLSLPAVIPVNPAFAAATTNTQQANPTAALEEIVVTARRREERLQQTPVAITALSAKLLSQSQISNISDLDRMVPNVSIRTGGGQQGQSFIFIRGIGLFSDDPSLEPGVAIYVDDVYLPRTQGGLFDLNDVSQIEVLRGPQGTLYGKNSMGGAIKVQSIQPSDHPEAKVSLSYGNLNEGRLAFSINHPIIADKLYMRVSGAIHRRDAITQNALPGGNSINDINTTSGRIMLRYAPASSPLDITWSADYYADRSLMASVRLVGLVATPLNQAITAQFGSLQPYLWTPGQNPDIGGGYDVMSDPGIGRQPYETVFGTSVKAKWEGDNIAFKSITAYRNLNNSRILDLDATPVRILDIGDTVAENQFSEEFQVIGNIANNKLQYIGGLYYFRERIAHDFRTSAPFVGLADNRQNHVGTDSYAAYANATWNITSALSGTVGARYTSEKRSLSTNYENAGVQVFGPASQQKTFQNFTPKVEVDYKWTPDIMTYASFSEGFRSGGFNAQPLSQDGFTSYQPEKAYSYELGAKTSFWNHRATFNLAAFHTKYNNLQESVVTTINNQLLRVTANAAESRTNGVELESQVKIIPALTLQAMFGLTDAKYLKYVDPSLGDVTNNALPEISKYNYQLSANYVFTPLEFASSTAHVDWSWRSTMFLDVANTPQLRQPGYGLLNARLSTNFDNGLDIAFYGKNLLNKRTMQSGSSALDSFGIAWAYFNDPITYGAEVSFHF